MSDTSMIVMFRSNFTFSEIEAVEVESVTPSFVRLNGVRRAKHTGHESYHNTWEEAYEHLYKRSKEVMRHIQSDYDYEYQRLQKVIALKRDVKGLVSGVAL